VDVLIESTSSFEQDLDKLSKDERTITVKKINECTSLFPTQEADGYRKLDPNIHRLSDLNGYESSLYTLRVSQKLRVVLTVDEDPIFGQIIFTLFRVVDHDDLDKAYQGIAESLYQEIRHHDRETAQVS
jgi:mRNA-degrading endonuclease RelE of RelBE toxin-antitoxin system